MKKYFLLFTFFLISAVVGVCSPTTSTQSGKNTIAIKNVMMQQVEDWNAGNIPGFMQCYWQSDELQFIGKTGITKGWNATLQSYLKAYPDKATMGFLTFSELQFVKLNRKEYLVIGKWALTNTAKNPSGYFTLHWKKINGKWLIVMDHTS